ncbi:hypothetical protein TorRG33x02_358150 [Trema orientale]|uniref:Uncharacterized protein n=1 Tax=Trema orientale TaxID=63057 RepID=A0A2P5A477_TREOI|nr:hypothetical protein TorRG33x02_358150 [Trema orientale]
MNLDAVEASFDCINIDTEKRIKVKRCGIHMIYGQEAGEECPTSQHATIVDRICQDLTLSIDSESEKMSIHECRGCSTVELERLGDNAYAEHSIIASSFIGSYSDEIIPECHDRSSNSNNEDNGFLASELLEEPKVVTNQPEASGTEPINSDAEESNLQRIKCFNICGCLPFLVENEEGKLNTGFANAFSRIYGKGFHIETVMARNRVLGNRVLAEDIYPDAVEASVEFSCCSDLQLLNFDLHERIKIKRCGVRMIYLQETGEEGPSQVDSTIGSYSAMTCSNLLEQELEVIGKLPQPNTGTEIIRSNSNPDADESHLKRMKSFIFFRFLTFLSIISGNLL